MDKIKEEDKEMWRGQERRYNLTRRKGTMQTIMKRGKEEKDFKIQFLNKAVTFLSSHILLFLILYDNSIASLFVTQNPNSIFIYNTSNLQSVIY